MSQETRLFKIECTCGKALEFKNAEGWHLNIIGTLQAKCPCGTVYSIPPIFGEGKYGTSIQASTTDSSVPKVTQ